MNRSVKALIYNRNGQLLMQQRDLHADIPFPGHWTFFGGQLEEGESTLDGLQRELEEEIGKVPGEVEDEIFTWLWESDWAATMNHYFPINFEGDVNTLELNEGNAMQWFYLDELIDQPIINGVYENFANLAKYLVKYDTALVQKIEAKLMSYCDLVKKHERVFYAKENPCAFSHKQIFLLKELAVLNNVAVFRICMHTTDTANVHEMLMIHTRLTVVGPLKQEKTSLSYHMIAGSLIIKMHSDDGDVIKEYVLDNKDGYSSIRLDATKFRSVHTNAPFAIFLEVASGPFVDNDTIWMYGRNIN